MAAVVVGASRSSTGRSAVAWAADEAALRRLRLIVVHATRSGRQLEDLNRLLWATTVLARQVPVLVIADRYRIDQATTLYRMGVTEYISRTHHADQFGLILDSYLRHTPAPGPRSSAGAEEITQSTKTWSSTARSVSAQVV